MKKIFDRPNLLCSIKQKSLWTQCISTYCFLNDLGVSYHLFERWTGSFLRIIAIFLKKNLEVLELLCIFAALFVVFILQMRVID